MLTVSRQYHFEAAHFLPNVKEGHRCKRMHGHNYRIEITLGGALTEHEGWILDFWDMDAVMQPILDLVDHRLLNEIEGLENPTAEHIAEWFFQKLEDPFGYQGSNRSCYLDQVTVWEVDGSKAVYRASLVQD